MTYAAYLRIYEPVSAFHEPDRSRWAAYAASAARPRRRDSLMVEQAEALRRAITTPQIVVPERESDHAYVRHADGVTYVCPWQTRLRCLISYSRMRSAPGSPLTGTLPAGEEDRAVAAWPGWRGKGGRAGSTRLHILASVWAVPLAWFVPFAAAERWLSLGPGRDRASAPQTASAHPGAGLHDAHVPRAQAGSPGPGRAATACPSGSGDATWEPPRAGGGLAEVDRWLEEFHPYSLVELDYGGLVHLVSDDALLR